LAELTPYQETYKSVPAGVKAKERVSALKFLTTTLLDDAP